MKLVLRDCCLYAEEESLLLKLKNKHNCSKLALIRHSLLGVFRRPGDWTIYNYEAQVSGDTVKHYTSCLHHTERDSFNECVPYSLHLSKYLFKPRESISLNLL